MRPEDAGSFNFKIYDAIDRNGHRLNNDVSVKQSIDICMKMYEMKIFSNRNIITKLKLR